jgi:hypothetical protein
MGSLCPSLDPRRLDCRLQFVNTQRFLRALAGSSVTDNIRIVSLTDNPWVGCAQIRFAYNAAYSRRLTQSSTFFELASTMGADAKLAVQDRL